MGFVQDHMLLAKELAKYSRLCDERRLVGAAGGNLSVRIPGTNLFLVTASGVALRDVSAENLVVMDAEGNVIETPEGLKASKEAKFHLAIFTARPEVNAVVHVHPPYATVSASAGKAIPQTTVSAKLKLRQGPIVEVADPGSVELTQNVATAMKGADEETTVLLMKRHGLVAFDTTLCGAFNDAELAEDTAKIAYLEKLMEA